MWRLQVSREHQQQSPLVELENEKRAVYRTAEGKLLYMCQERADIMYSVKENSTKDLCPTENDEIERCPECKVLGRNHYTPAARERVHRQRLGRTAHDLQEHKRWSCAVGQRNPFCVVTNTTVSALELRRSRTACLDYWNRRRVTNHILKELGYEVTLVNHVDSRSAKAGHPTEGQDG